MRQAARSGILAGMEAAPIRAQVEGAAGLRRSDLVTLAVATVVAFPLIMLAVWHHPAGFVAQSRANLFAAGQASLTEALERYPKALAPLYPSILWVAGRADVSPAIFNVGAQSLLAGLLATALRRRFGATAAGLGAALWVASYPAARSAFQITAEPLFALLALGVFVLLERPDPSLARAAATGLLTGVTALVRYFGFFWPALPLLLVLAGAPGTVARRAMRVAAAAVLMLAIPLPWLLHVRDVTGHISGMDRRTDVVQMKEFAHWNEHRDFGTNVAFSAKTVLIDWFSPDRIATHGVVIETPVSTSEWILGAAAIGLLAWGAFVARRRGPFEPGAKRLAAFVAAYFVVLIGVWSFANNDPIYTRFLVPVYPFLILAGFALAQRAGPRLRDRAPFALLYILCLATSLLRHARAVSGVED